MSWWVMEQVSVNEAGTQTLANIQCDDVSDLPAPDQSATAGYTIVRGSQATVLATSEKYILGSAGTWVKMEDGVKLDLTGYATEQYVDDGLTEKVDTTVYSSGQAAQDAEINVLAALGAKNLFRNDKNAGATVVKQGATWIFDQTSVEAKVSGNVSATWSDVFLLNSNFDLSDKEYTIVIESDSPDVFVYITGNTLSGGNIPSNGQYYPGVYRYKGVMTTSTRFTAKTASYSNNTIRCMICPASITDTTYVPYAPTNRELYELCETKASLNDIYGIKKQLPNGTDLNNLSAGIMMCPGATIAATLINCPTTTDAFIIYTDYLAVTSRVIQRIYSFSTTTGIPSQYMRVRWSEGWTPWYQVMMQ